MPNDLLEYLIETCYRKMRDSTSVEQQKHWWTRMTTYIAQRSPDTIERMERERGLA